MNNSLTKWAGATLPADSPLYARYHNIFTKIGWTDLTFNPWIGCTRVSPACRFCYAELVSKRFSPDAPSLWRRSGPRRLTGPGYWRAPETTWKALSEALGRPLLVFSGSLCDVFEDHPVIDLDEPRARLWALIERTPYLTWQLLTKRPENISGMVPWKPGAWPQNVWLGVSIEQERYATQRLPFALATGAREVFGSFEPLMEAVDLSPYVGGGRDKGLGWAIVGGESGKRSEVRRMNPEHVDDLLGQCERYGIPAFMKQAGVRLAAELGVARTDRKGELLESLPLAWRVRRYPSHHEAALDASTQRLAQIPNEVHR